MNPSSEDCPSKRILLTTAYRRGGYYDYTSSNYYGEGLISYVKLGIPRRISYGLRFIKQNIPSVEILEYPTWSEYISKLREGWDIVGFSFYLNEVYEVIEMVQAARSAGAGEVWGGNYGVLTYGLEDLFDRTFIGHSEHDIAKELGFEIDRIVHPPLIGYSDLGGLLKINHHGILFTSRGCNVGCSFCQTPAFCSKPSKISLESLDRVMEYYHKNGIRTVVILDENFGMFRSHSEEVIELFEKHDLKWGAMLRAEFLKKNIDDWVERGFFLGLVGIESLNQSNLDAVNKREQIDDILEAVRIHESTGIGVFGYYMLGFENETVESIKKDIMTLKKLNITLTQVCALTPLPRTPLWKHLDSNFGIFEKDYHKYDLKNLVWNHPNIKPDEMRDLLNWSLHELNGNYTARSLSKLIGYYLKFGPINGTVHLAKHIYRANTFNYRERFL